MQPPGGGQPPSERKGKLPPPFGGGARPPTTTGAPPPGPPAPPATTLPGGHQPAPQPQPYAPPAPAPQQPQPYAQPAPQPYAPPAPQPYAQPAPQPQPYAQPPGTNAYVQPNANPYNQPHAQPPHGQPAKLPPAPSPPPPTVAAPQPAPAAYAPPPAGQPARLPLPPPGSVPGIAVDPAAPSPMRHAPVPSLRPDHGFVEFLQISLKRAFRLRIDHDQVTPQERTSLAAAGITDPSLQSFLAWRRSVLFAFASLMVPLLILKAIDTFSTPEDPGLLKEALGTLRGLETLVLLVDVAFCGLCWHQLREWTNWRKQRRLLALGWLAFFIAPFLVFLYPLRSAVPMEGASGAEAKAIGVIIGSLFSVQAMMLLAPKAVSLIAGLVRSAIVTKLLFPGNSAPGWLVVLAAPIYALFIYVVLIVPYQITGSGYFVLAIIGLITAEYFLGRGGYNLTRPMARDEAIKAVKQVRQAYFIALGIGALFVVVALAELVDQLDFEAISVVTLIGTFLTNVWILTLITTDALIANLDRARGVSAGTAGLAEESNRQLAAFVSADLPPGPPPPT